jgi:hypothetical protein
VVDADGLEQSVGGAVQFVDELGEIIRDEVLNFANSCRVMVTSHSLEPAAAGTAAENLFHNICI